MSLISSIIGIVSLVIALIGIIPLLGWLNWIALALSAIGLIIGLLAFNKTGRNINLVVLVLAILRLMLGGGVI